MPQITDSYPQHPGLIKTQAAPHNFNIWLSVTTPPTWRHSSQKHHPRL